MEAGRIHRQEVEAGRIHRQEVAAVRSHLLEEEAPHNHLQAAVVAGCSRRRAEEEVAAAVGSGCTHLAEVVAAEEAATAADRSRPGVRPTFNSSF